MVSDSGIGPLAKEIALALETLQLAQSTWGRNLAFNGKNRIHAMG